MFSEKVLKWKFNFPDEINYKWPNLNDTKWNHGWVIECEYEAKLINNIHPTFQAQSVYFDLQL